MKARWTGIVLAGLVGLALAAGCSSSSSGGSATDKCTMQAGMCTGGLTLTYCYSPDANGGCSGAPYFKDSNGKTYNCNSCTDVAACTMAAGTACGGGGGDAGGGG
jgi:hypothetical protein